MSGGIVQLVATGAQDTWLTGKPEVSFYRSSYKRYTHYSRSVERQLIQGTPTAGGISTIRFEKKGDLMNYVYFIAKDGSGALIPGIDWSKVVDKVELLIGGQIVDTQDMVWSTQVEPVTGAQNYSQRYLNNNTDGLTNVINGFYPLKFFFCKDWNLSLPLVALQYHDIELRITWNANLGYRVGYELYTVPVATSTANAPTPASSTFGIASTSSPTGVTTFTGLTATISATSLVTAQLNQANGAFSYANATMQMVPGMKFSLTGMTSAPIVVVVAVFPTTSTSGTFTGYLLTTSIDTSYPATSLTLNSYQSTAGTGATMTLTVVSGTASYSSVAISWTAGSFVPTVNSVLTAATPTANGRFGTYATGYITSITFSGTSGQNATLGIAVVGDLTTGLVNFAGAYAVFTPAYPVINVVLSAAATGGTVASGQTILGGTLLNQIPPTVNTVYSSTIISVNTNQFGIISTTGTAATLTPTALNTQFSAAKPYWFIPTTYYTGIISDSSLATLTTGNAGGAVLAIVPAYTTINGANTTTNVVPSLGGSIYFWNAGQLNTNVYVASVTSNVSIGINYAASATTTGIAQYSHFFVVPQTGVRGFILNQSYVDREGSTIVQLNSVIGTIAVGQQVVGTQYTGPVTVSQIISTSGSFTAGTGVATIEIQFPSQSQVVQTTTTPPTMITFIDPTNVTVPTGITVSTTGFNGTYAQLQYEAWTNFVYLDQAERDYFANTPMDMLITQINRIPIASTNMQELALAHPIKFIAFLANNYTTAYQTQATTNIPATNYYYKQQINGVDVGDSRSLFQWQDVPQYYFTPFGYNHNGSVAPVSLISYCLDTSKLQPTGTLNFSRIDTYRIVAPVGVPLTQISGATNPYFYAMNYNVLRIKDGMAGLLYSN